jgi:hypothetical protein
MPLNSNQRNHNHKRKRVFMAHQNILDMGVIAGENLSKIMSSQGEHECHLLGASWNWYLGICSKGS